MAQKRIFASLAMIAAIFWLASGLRAAPEAAILWLASGLRAAPEEGTPAATVEMHVTHVALGIGFTKGDDYINYNGKHYKFKVRGLDAVGLGITTLNAEGDVYNLASLDDFPGTYFGAEAAGTFIKKSKGLVIKNIKGVVINLKTSKTGLGLRLGDQGLRITPAWE